MRSGTSPVAMPRAILSTISVCGMYDRLIGLSGLAVFQSQTSWSTMPLLPPDRSHISIALSAVLWAQSAAGSGVGTAASADGDSAGAALGDSAAGAEASPPVDGAADEGVPPLHAVATNMTRNARVGSRRWFRIASCPPSRSAGPDGASAALRPPRLWHHTTIQTSAYIRFHRPVEAP